MLIKVRIHPTDRTADAFDADYIHRGKKKFNHMVDDATDDEDDEVAEAGYIRVLVRLRPLDPRRGHRTDGTLRVDIKNATLEHGSHHYGPYTQVCEDASNGHLFGEVGQELVTAAQRGFNGTLFCYGQTGRSAAPHLRAAFADRLCTKII